jgi:hemerythrin
LDEYTRVHFAVEESLMRILHYPDYERHKEEHDKLIAQLAELRTRNWMKGKGSHRLRAGATFSNVAYQAHHGR